MVVVVVAAIFGAALGLFVRNGVIALGLALSVVGLAQFAAILAAQALAAQPGHEALAAGVASVAGASPWALAPSLAASGAGAIIAALMLALGQPQDAEREFWRPGQRLGPGGRGLHKGQRSRTAVEERAIHERAGSRLNKLMRQ